MGKSKQLLFLTEQLEKLSKTKVILVEDTESIEKPTPRFKVGNVVIGKGWINPMVITKSEYLPIETETGTILAVKYFGEVVQPIHSKLTPVKKHIGKVMPIVDDSNFFNLKTKEWVNGKDELQLFSQDINSPFEKRQPWRK